MQSLDFQRRCIWGWHWGNGSSNCCHWETSAQLHWLYVERTMHSNKLTTHIQPHKHRQKYLHKRMKCISIFVGSLDAHGFPIFIDVVFTNSQLLDTVVFRYSQLSNHGGVKCYFQIPCYSIQYAWVARCKRWRATSISISMHTRRKDWLCWRRLSLHHSWQHILRFYFFCASDNGLIVQGSLLLTKLLSHACFLLYSHCHRWGTIFTLGMLLFWGPRKTYRHASPCWSARMKCSEQGNNEAIELQSPGNEAPLQICRLYWSSVPCVHRRLNFHRQIICGWSAKLVKVKPDKKWSTFAILVHLANKYTTPIIHCPLPSKLYSHRPSALMKLICTTNNL